jgi:hypothetical protein
MMDSLISVNIGYIASMSLVTVPVCAVAPPAIAVKQWAKAYAMGASTAPFIAIASSLSFGYLASQGSNISSWFLPYNIDPALAAKLPTAWYSTPLDPRPSFNLYTAAAVLIPAIVPFTLIVIKKTNSKLFAKAEFYDTQSAAEKKEDEELAQLFKRWRVLNLIRACFPALGAVAGLWAVIARPEFVGLKGQ